MVLKMLKGIRTRNTAATAVKLFGAATSYTMMVAVARATSVDGFGRFSFGFSLATVISLIAGLGMNSSILRFWPQYLAQNRTDLAQGVVAWSVRWTIIATIIQSALLTAAVAFYNWRWGHGSAGYLYGSAALLIVMSVAQYLSGVLRAKGYIIRAFAPMDVVWRVAVMLVMGAAIAAAMRLTASQALWACAITLGVIAAYQIYFSSRQFAKDWVAGLGREDSSSWWRVSLFLCLTGVLFIVPRQIDVLILGVALPAAKTGMYFAAVRTAGVLTIFTQAAFAVGAPLFAKSYYSGDKEGMIRWSHRLTIEVAVQSTIAYALMVAFGVTILGSFGKSYQDGYLLLVVIGFSYLFGNITGPAYRLLSMTGHEKQFFIVQAAGHLLGALARVGVLLVTDNLVAFAVVSALTSMLISVLAAVQTYIHLGFDSTIFGAVIHTIRNRGTRRPPSQKAPG